LWWSSRINSLLNTLAPLHLFLLGSQRRNINSVGELSPRIIHFFFQYWNTLPLGFGIVGIPVLLVGLWWFARRHPYQCALLVVTPFLFFWIFFGADSSGLMRDGLHVWALTLIYAVAISFKELSSAHPNIARWGVSLLALRGLEILAMLLAPAVVTNRQVVSKLFSVNDTAALVVMVLTTGVLMVRLLRSHPELRRFEEPGLPAH
jgi:hypothetical protein